MAHDQRASGFAAITMMANCIENAAILAYVNSPDSASLEKVLHKMHELQHDLTDQCPCKCHDDDDDADDCAQAAFVGWRCENNDDCGGAGFRCKNGRCILV